MHQNEFNVAAVYGGSPMGAQRAAINSGADVISATPGRLIDLL
jgi:superfamily II DNA/RNA helicase